MDPRWQQGFLPTADRDYRLPKGARERLNRVLNADVFEALLARLKPEHRSELLASTLELASLGKVTFGPMFSDVIDDPELIELLANIARPPSRER